ncbi:MAG TPA: hypothetical protein VMT72_17880 [Pseudolabrys sp.]|nr:hypothetical protein [Pseudolabrys sp.]
MENSPYLKEHRLQDLLAAVQFLAAYPNYDLTAADFHKKIATNPKSAGDWGKVFAEHPEFFRQSEGGADYSLVLRRARPKADDGRRPPLSSSEISMLFDTAIHLQKHALEIRRERRAFWPILVAAVGVATAFAGTILGALIKGS